MSSDDIVRTVAVAAAIALLSAPYASQIRDAAAAATEAIRRHGSLLTRLIGAGLIVAAAWGKIPIPTLPAGGGSIAPGLTITTPEASMQRAVEPVRSVVASMPMGDRMLWAATWSKVAAVVAGDVESVEVVFSDTRALRMFTAISLDIAWRRIGGNPPGNDTLRKAVESAYHSAVGDEDVAMTDAIRTRYVDLARAMAWAAMPGG